MAKKYRILLFLIVLGGILDSLITYFIFFVLKYPIKCQPEMFICERGKLAAEWMNKWGATGLFWLTIISAFGVPLMIETIRRLLVWGDNRIDDRFGRKSNSSKYSWAICTTFLGNVIVWYVVLANTIGLVVAESSLLF